MLFFLTLVSLFSFCFADKENVLKNHLLENYYSDNLPSSNTTVELSLGIAFKSLTYFTLGLLS